MCLKLHMKIGVFHLKNEGESDNPKHTYHIILFDLKNKAVFF